jgi:hypothetical protein
LPLHDGYLPSFRQCRLNGCVLTKPDIAGEVGLAACVTAAPSSRGRPESACFGASARIVTERMRANEGIVVSRRR